MFLLTGFLVRNMNILALIYQIIGAAGICGWVITILAWTNPIQTKSFGYISVIILLSYIHVYALRKIFPDKLKNKDSRNSPNEDWWNEETDDVHPVLSDAYLITVLLSGFSSFLIWTIVKENIL
jgi:hypothetical protein